MTPCRIFAPGHGELAVAERHATTSSGVVSPRFRGSVPSTVVRDETARPRIKISVTACRMRAAVWLDGGSVFD
jgi:hypothetical protein